MANAHVGRHFWNQSLNALPSERAISADVLLPQTRSVLSRFAASVQAGLQTPLRSMNQSGATRAASHRILKSIADLMTVACNALNKDHSGDLATAMDRWKAGKASGHAEPDTGACVSEHESDEARLKLAASGLDFLFPSPVPFPFLDNVLDIDEAPLLFDLLTAGGNNPLPSRQSLFDGLRSIQARGLSSLRAALKPDSVAGRGCSEASEKEMMSHDVLLMCLRLVRSHAGRQMLDKLIAAAVGSNPCSTSDHLPLMGQLRAASDALKELNLLYRADALIIAAHKLKVHEDDESLSLRDVAPAVNAYGDSADSKPVSKEYVCLSVLHDICAQKSQASRQATTTAHAFFLRCGIADVPQRNAAAHALAGAAKWLKQADQTAFKRLLCKTPFHGLSRLPSDLRIPTSPGGIEHDESGGSTSSDEQCDLTSDSASMSADAVFSLSAAQSLPAHINPGPKASKQLRKIFSLIDSMLRVDRITLQRGRFAGLHSGGLTDVLSGAFSALLARVTVHTGFAFQRSRQFFLYMNESWLEMQFNTVAGAEAELGLSVGAGVSDINMSDHVHLRAGGSVRLDALSTQREKINGIVIRIPCKWDGKPGPEYDDRVRKAKVTAKQILLIMQEAGRNSERSDGHHILQEIAGKPEFSDVSIQMVHRASRQRASTKFSIDAGVAVRATHALFTGALVRLGLERVWKETVSHQDPTLQSSKQSASVVVSATAAAGFSAGTSGSVLAPFEASAGLQGALAKDEEGLHWREVDDGVSPWSFREVAFSDAQSLYTYVKRWCEVHGKPASIEENKVHSYNEWEQDLLRELERWKDEQHVSTMDREEYDFTYAARFRLSPEAIGRLDIINARCEVLSACIDRLLAACETSHDDKTNPRPLSFLASERRRESIRLQEVDRSNRRALNQAIFQLKKLKHERTTILRDINNFDAPVLYAYKNAGHKDVLGLKMLAGTFSRTAVTRRDTKTVMRHPSLRAYHKSAGEYRHHSATLPGSSTPQLNAALTICQ